ncbi:hypothetical protein [Haloarcula sp. JP-L23]|uniref:hypothetical protein n=1 Tax=Haloarcula sp. JP-L23 TaxID=2716717 RepID=UPI00140EA7CE|nr:hypothetical protein G9465_05385 [Haloarcula sp. JP-L23]
MTRSRNVIEKVEARLALLPRWKPGLGAALLIPPISIVGMVYLAYELHEAGKKLSADL